MESLTKELEKIKISNEIYFGDDLINEKNVMENLQKEIEKEILNLQCSFFFSVRDQCHFALRLRKQLRKLQRNYYQ